MSTILTVPQVAATLGVSRQRVCILIKMGRLKAHRCESGSCWLVKPADLKSLKIRPEGRPKNKVGENQ